MSALDHWHPVLRREALGKKPMRANIAGTEVVVFRTASGALGALRDRCPHRAMRLSEGHVEGERVVCPYHGWQWAPDGQGRSPGTPTAKPCAEAFDVVERDGAIWVRRAGATTAFPVWDTQGMYEVGRVQRRVKVPLALCLDNFIEVEHTPTTHLLLGYDPSRMHEVVCRVTADEDRVRVYNEGPQRALPGPLRTLFGVPPGSRFVDDWTTFFSPVYTVYEQYFLSPDGARLPQRLRIAVFFNPVGERETELFVFTHSVQPPWGRLGLNAALFPITRVFLGLEVERDVSMLERLADTSPEIKGNALGRFDKALLLARSRVQSRYHGRDATHLPLHPDEEDR